ncbi:MAG TPA: hypothetical protein VNI83_15800 [Vicinamibacterales bacterium]|nr:hypothetical protein [Vicinamibacterales bacterium]
MKVFLPGWVLRVLLPMIAVLWAIVTYAAFATPSGRGELGVVGWLGVTVVFGLVALMLWLMASRRLPAYIIEIEDADDGRDS